MAGRHIEVGAMLAFAAISAVPVFAQDQKVEEILVTAQKRSEKLMDVPNAVSAISGERLESMQINSIADLASYVPGASVMAGGSPGYRSIVLRGINSSYENNSVAATVATYIDDLPVGGSTSANRGGQYGVDLQPFDIERIEVLKGPQGTLYGANTLGGLVKYVLRRPSLTRFEARAGSDLRYVDGAGGLDWSIRGSLNMPVIEDKLGVLFSGYEKHAAGYIDNVGTGTKDSNESKQRGGRASLYWKPSETLSVRATVLAEDISMPSMTSVTVDGAVRPIFGYQTVDTLFLEPYEQQTRSYALTVDWDVGFASVTSASGWSKIDYEMTQDLTVPYGAYCGAGSLGPDWPGCPDYPFGDALSTWKPFGYLEKFVQEVRLTSPAEQRFQWMLGGYYTKEKNAGGEYFPSFTPDFELLPPDNDILSSENSGSFRETAGFANVTYQFTKKFDVSAGSRYSSYSSSECTEYVRGIFGFPNPPCRKLPSQSVTLWMGNVRYHLNDDTMIYSRIATGYRPGGGCPECGIPTLNIPGIVRPDETTNYEVGVKGQFFERRLQLDMSVFQIDWTDIQLTLNSAEGFGYPGNGGDAVSRGVELAASYEISDGLRANITVARTDAHLTRISPDAAGASVGDSLPVSPKWTASVAGDYVRPLSDKKSFLLGGGYRYRDAIVNSIGQFSYQAPALGPQNIVDLYAGMVIDQITVRLNGTNVLNDRSYNGALFVNDQARPRLVPAQPRTFGVSVDYQF